MTLPSDNDRLVNFLHHHRPKPPEAPPDLEDRIMTQVQTEIRSSSPRRSTPPSWQRRLAVPALAASALLAWGGWVSWRAPMQQTADLAVVDDFLTETWYSSAYGDETFRLALNTTEPNWLFSVYANPY